MSSNLPLISVIVPVYNVEKYLSKCVDSILAQTYTNLEIILVDDGSPDNCGKICDEYAQKDSRIKVIHQKNSGLSAARNAGLDIATGDYIGFVDSDDYILPEMYESLLNMINVEKADVSIADYEFVDNNGMKFGVFSPMTNSVYTNIQIINKLFDEYYCYYVTVWNRLYKADLFTDLRFDTGKKFEDAFIAHKIFLRANKIATTDKKLYFYLQRSDSIMSNQSSIIKCDELEALSNRIADLNELEIIFDVEKACRQFFDIYKDFKKRFNPKSYTEKNRVSEVDCMAKRLYKLPYNKPTFKEHIIFHCLPLYPFIAKLKNSVINLLKLICLKFKQLFSDFILINLPNYGNLGDQAIAVAEIQLLNDFKKKVLPIDERIIRDIGSAFYRYISKSKTIIVCGGGFSGCLWPECENNYIQIPLKILRNNRIIIFPQTVTFDLSTESGREYFDNFKTAYINHSKLTLFVRERKSYDFVKEYLPGVTIALVPDIVLNLRVSDFNRVRGGILFCLRSDREKSTDSCDSIISAIEEKYGDSDIVYTDNIVNREITSETRKKEVYEVLKKYASSKLVITDRLHGMIFAAITNTPCIALDNINGKVGGVYDWIKGNEYIRFCKTLDEVKEAIESLDLDKEYHFDKAAIEEAMKPLYEVLNG